MNFLQSLFLLLCVSMTALAGPFDDGVKKVQLSPEERSSLLQYADNSKAKLDKALSDASGLDIQTQTEIYLKAIEEVVVASYQNKPRSELLMRICLNQALELTVGVPVAPGYRTPGALAGAANEGLHLMILEDSIKMAISYYQDDRAAIEKGTLSNLPYSEVAEKRLNAGRTWILSVLEYGYQYQASIQMLQHWQNVVHSDDNLARAIFAEEILMVDEILRNEPSVSADILKNPARLPQEVRYLRGVLQKLSKATAEKNTELQEARNEQSASQKEAEEERAAAQEELEFDRRGYAVVTNSQYLVNITLPADVKRYVGQGSRVEILEKRLYIGIYSDSEVKARKVRIITNTDKSVIAAKVGLVGWLIASDVKMKSEIIGTPTEINLRTSSLPSRNEFFDIFKKLAQRKGVDSKIMERAEKKSFEFKERVPETFQMGSSSVLPEEKDKNQHTVTLTKAYHIQLTTVTQLQWYLVMGNNPSHFLDLMHADNDHENIKGIEININHPIENVSWNDTQMFIEKLNKIDSKCTYRLPTEAEWEAAAIVGRIDRPYNFTPDSSYSWYYQGSSDRTHAVATKLPNPDGLYDMFGNVEQWVNDKYGSYGKDPVTDPQGSASGPFRISRGFNARSLNLFNQMRPTYRRTLDPNYHDFGETGFRLVRSCL